jgi:uncharacterized protein YutE (UPF0331/DUF86 family)
MNQDLAVLAEKVAAVERHLRRVEERLPEQATDLRPMTDASDAVILHLWQAVQIVVDLAVSTCVAAGLGSPNSYGDAFRKLAEAGRVDRALADRLARAAGFRNVLAHAYETLDMAIVHRAAQGGPADLRAFLASLRPANPG